LQNSYLYRSLKAAIDTTGKIAAKDGLPVAISKLRETLANLEDVASDYSDIDVQTSTGVKARYQHLVTMIHEAKHRLINTPWETMNKAVSFLRQGDMAIIAARQSIGKTWQMLYWCNYLASRQNKCLFFSKEMSRETIEDRLEAMRLGINYVKLRAGTLSGADLRKWNASKKARRGEPYPVKIIGDTSEKGIGIDFICAKIREYKPEVVFIDGAYLLQVDGASAKMEDTQRYSMISRRLKAVALAYNVILIISLQFNRTVEDKTGKAKAALSAIYGSDAWGQDADWVISIEGKRGANSRLVKLVKGRESAVVNFHALFSVTPPCFDEAKPGQIVDTGGDGDDEDSDVISFKPITESPQTKAKPKLKKAA
jgi:replicative DNA helicase